MIVRRTKVFLSQGEWDKSAFLVYRAKKVSFKLLIAIRAEHARRYGYEEL